MLFPRSAPALRNVVRRTAACSSVRSIARTSPLRSASGHSPPAGVSSDIPWIVGAIGITISGSYYLLRSSPPRPKHADDAHVHAGAAFTSPDSNAESQSAERNEEATSSDAIGAALDVGETVANPAETARDDASGTGDKVTEAVTSAPQSTIGKAEEKVVPEKAAEIKSEVVPEKTSQNPQEIDPGNTALKESGSMNVTSGKQQGLSNDDTAHAILNDERGEALSKKAEGVHDSAKLKGTVDVNRPAK